MGLKEGRFSRFVFDQCYQQGQYARLLRFGEEFGEEVAAYLEQHPLLLWLHQLFLRRFTRAADTLHTLAFSPKSAHLKISHRRRLLHLAKLSALAGTGYRRLSMFSTFDKTLSVLYIPIYMRCFSLSFAHQM